MVHYPRVVQYHHRNTHHKDLQICLLTLRSVKRSQWQKADEILSLSQDDVLSLGKFLSAIFYDRPRGAKDPLTPRHRVIGSALWRESKISTVDIIIQIYSHCDLLEPTIPPTEILHALPSMSTWATQLIGLAVHHLMCHLTKNDSNDPDDCTQLRAIHSSPVRCSGSTPIIGQSHSAISMWILRPCLRASVTVSPAHGNPRTPSLDSAYT